MEDSEDKTAAAIHDLLNYVKRLEGRLDAVEEGRSQASAPSTSPGSQRGSHTSENASVFRETLKNYGPFGQRMTVNDLSGEDGIERGVDIRAGAARAQQEYPRQAQGQGMVRDMPPQRHPVMNPFGPSGGVTIPKLNIQNFNGAEIYAGLGAGFKQWAYLFIEAIEVTELSSGFAWTERLKVNKLGEHMEVHAASYFQANIGIWWAVSPQLYYVLDQMHNAFKVNITHQQAANRFAAEKNVSRSWTEHFLYLVALARESGSHEKLIVEKIVKYAAPHLKMALMIRYNPQRQDYIQHAQELIAWAQELEGDLHKPKKSGQNHVNSINEAKPQRSCYNCGMERYIRKDCPHTSKRTKRFEKKKGRQNDVDNDRRYALNTVDEKLEDFSSSE